jgi:hypothetical protein
VSGDGGLLLLGDILAADYGQWARIPFLIGFFAVSFTSVIGVWHGVSLLFADCWRTLRTSDTGPLEGSRAYKGYVLWLTFPPMALLFLDQPFQLTVAYGALGALFMPFLAGTLLVLLNSKRMDRSGRSGWVSNTMLVACLVLFAYLAYNQVVGLFE